MTPTLTPQWATLHLSSIARIRRSKSMQTPKVGDNSRKSTKTKANCNECSIESRGSSDLRHSDGTKWYCRAAVFLPRTRTFFVKNPKRDEGAKLKDIEEPHSGDWGFSTKRTRLTSEHVGFGQDKTRTTRPIMLWFWVSLTFMRSLMTTPSNSYSFLCKVQRWAWGLDLDWRSGKMRRNHEIGRSSAATNCCLSIWRSGADHLDTWQAETKGMKLRINRRLM